MLMDERAYRRVVYTSRAREGAGHSDLAEILGQSRGNNGIDGLSGLLWTDGDRYVQLLEGPPGSVAATLERIVADPRHDQIRFVYDEQVADRAFGDWSMANLPGDKREVTADRMTLALRGAPAEVRDMFLQMAAA